MEFKSIFKDLRNSLTSDPEFLLAINEEDEEEEDNYIAVNPKRVRLMSNSIPQPQLQFTDWKLIFEMNEEEFLEIQKHSHPLLDEIFTLTMDWPSGILVTLIDKYDASLKAISDEHPYTNSIFNTPINQIPSNLKCQISNLPIVIVELMRLLGQPECLRTIGAFRIESADTKILELEKSISCGTETATFKLQNVSIVGMTSLIKRFYRNIPGQICGRPITDLLYRISVSFEGSPCMNTIIRWALSCLPLNHYQALGLLCLLLKSYSKHESINLMSTESLAICWTPILFDVDANIEQISRITKILSLLIKNWDKFFFYPTK